MKKIMIFSMFVIVNLNAVDVSSFDIKGIKLGMSESEVVKNMPCNNPKKSIGWAGHLGSLYTCEDKKIDFQVALDYKKKVFHIYYAVNFSIKPNFKIIESRLINKYGNTKHKSSSSEYQEPIYYRDLCWGDCKIYKNKGGVRYEATSNTSGLSADLVTSNHYNEYSMTLNLNDVIRYRKHMKYTKSKQLENALIEKDKATNIDF